MKGKEPRSGTVELLGQTCRCSWAVGDTLVTEKPVVQPVFLGRTTASNIFSALEATLPFVSLPALKALTARVRRVFLVLTGDLCPSNTRVKHAIAYAIAVHNSEAEAKGHGVIVMVDVNCNSHIIHTVVEKIFALQSFIPRMHAIAFSLSIPRTYMLLLRGLRSIIEKDMEVGFFPGTRPPPHLERQNATLIDMTLLRFIATRVRREELVGSAREERVRELASTLAALCNGDWAHPRLQHYCYQEGCCGNHDRSVCVEALFAVLSAFFTPLSAQILSITRWYTLGPQVSLQSGGCCAIKCCHAPWPRCSPTSGTRIRLRR